MHTGTRFFPSFLLSGSCSCAKITIGQSLTSFPLKTLNWYSINTQNYFIWQSECLTFSGVVTPNTRCSMFSVGCHKHTWPLCFCKFPSAVAWDTCRHNTANYRFYSLARLFFPPSIASTNFMSPDAGSHCSSCKWPACQTCQTSVTLCLSTFSSPGSKIPTAYVGRDPDDFSVCPAAAGFLVKLGCSVFVLLEANDNGFLSFQGKNFGLGLLLPNLPFYFQAIADLLLIRTFATTAVRQWERAK